MKITRILVILALTIVSINSYSENTKSKRIGFLVEPQCENEVRQYFDNLNKMRGFNAGMLEINDKHSSLKTFNYYGYIESNLGDKVQLDAYVNGAMRKCRANRQSEFDLGNPNVAQEFMELVKYETEKNPNDPLFISYEDGRLIVVYIGRD